MKIPDNILNAIEEINKASLEIPFGNSAFQNLNFVLGAEITPARQLRHCLLRLNNRLSALKECYYNLELENIDIEEMTENMKKWSTGKYEKRRIAVKLEQKIANRVQTEMLIKDCLHEIGTLYEAFQKLPKFTREQFEAEEKEHFELTLSRDAYFAITSPHAVGQLQSLDNMNSNNVLLMNALSSNEGSGELKKYIENARSSAKLIGG